VLEARDYPDHLNAGIDRLIPAVVVEFGLTAESELRLRNEVDGFIRAVTSNRRSYPAAMSQATILGTLLSFVSGTEGESPTR
jgi:hypothetical protein